MCTTREITSGDLVIAYREVDPRRWASPGKEYMFALFLLGLTYAFPSEEAVLTAKRQGFSRPAGRD